MLPKFGIEKEVRTCDSCFEKYGPQESDQPAGEKEPIRLKKEVRSDQSDLPAEYLASPLSKQPQVPEKQAGRQAGGDEEEEGGVSGVPETVGSAEDGGAGAGGG